MKNDPWKHRSDGMRCRTCMWYVKKSGPVGRCRRHAPTMSGYPVVYEADWCGDHKLQEPLPEITRHLDSSVYKQRPPGTIKDWVDALNKQGETDKAPERPQETRKGQGVPR